MVRMLRGRYNPRDQFRSSADPASRFAEAVAAESTLIFPIRPATEIATSFMDADLTQRADAIRARLVQLGDSL